MSDPGDYTVGWISAIPTESVAAQQFLDERHEGPEHVTQHDNNVYTLGKIGRHKIVMAALPKGEYGTTSAAMVARDMLHSFPNIRIGLLVGIGGGAPSAKHDVRLGDIVVSSRGGEDGGIFQYDFGKTIQEQAFQHTQFLDQPPPLLRAAVGGLETRYEADGHQLKAHVATILDAKARLRKKYSRPAVARDRLYRSDFVHRDPDQSCTDGCGDESDHLVARTERGEDDDDPAIHHGLIASANQLMKDAQIRDKLAAEKGVLCFEMEAAGLMNHFPCLVIRGICDYADSHKNKEWQGYAAMVAAAYAKDLLQQIPPSKVEAESRINETLNNIEQRIEDVHGTLFAMKAVNDSIKSNHHAGKIHRWLCPPDPSTNANYARNLRHKGSGTWLLESAAFREWQSGSRRHLWLYGLSGCGKTVLSTSILDHLQASEHIVLSFFFDFNDAAKRTMDGMLRSLAYQLSQRSAQSEAQLHSLFQSYQDGQKQPPTGALFDALRKMLVNHKSIYVVLDALDESTTKQELLDCLMAIISLPELAHLKLLCTGRPEREFLHRFPILIGEDNCVRLDGDAIDADIASYVMERLYRSPEFSRWAKYPKVLERIRNTIGSRSDGMFRWAACQLNSLEKCLDREAIETALASLPQDLNETYARMLDLISPESKQKAIRLLQFLAYSDRPLMLEEAVDVIAVRIDGNDGVFDEEDRMPVPAEIIGLCPSLVSLVHVQKRIAYERQELHLAHSSVQEYLRSEKCDFSGPKASISITCTCLAYLSCTRGVGDNVTSQFPLAKYAAQVWMDHARLAEGSNIIVELAWQFLQSSKRFVMWTRLYQPDIPWNDQPRETKASCLYFACLMGLVKVSRKLILQGVNVNAEGGRYSNPLYAASWEGHTEIVQLLLENKADVNIQGGGYGNTLQAASYQGRTEIVQLLLKNKADANAEGGRYGNALQAASYQGHNEIVQLLLENKADVNAQGGDYGNALQAALYRGHTEIMQLLLKNKADANAEGGRYGNALQAASYQGHTEIVQLLLDNKADVNAQGGRYGNALQAASYQGHTKIVQLLLENKADVNAHGGDYGGNYSNALQAASYQGHTEVVQLLLENKANVNAEGGRYGNPLYTASWEGHTEIVQLLLENNADVNAEGGRYGNPLYAVSWEGYTEIVQLLLENKANVNAQGGDYGNALQAASYQGHTESVQLLLENKADVNAQGGRYGNALQAASYQGHTEVVQLLLENKADVNAEGGRYGNPLYAASWEGHAEIVQLLLLAHSTGSLVESTRDFQS